MDLAFHRGEELPPVSLYKIGDRYFVEDGNHRVSVARYHGVQAVEADVTEFRRARRNSGRRARGRAEGEGRVSPWGTWLAYAWPTLLLTIIGLFLRRASRDPKTPRGDAVLVDLCLGLVAVVASVLWLRVFVSVAFRPPSPTTHPSLEFCP